MSSKVPVVDRSRSIKRLSSYLRLKFDSATGMILAILVCLCCPVANLAFGQSSGSRPNILLIFPDQLRAQALGCMGNPDVRTPNLDRLAAEGILFRQTLANTPVCCPARANLLTGKYAHRNGMIANDLRLRESETTLAEFLRQAGYRTGFIGKWHLDGGKRLPGFVPPGSRRQGFEFWAANECSHTHFDTQYFRDTNTPIPIQKFEAEAWTDIAIEFLHETRDQPFFLMIAMGPPHDPYGAPEKYMKMYDPKRLKLRRNWVEGIKGAGREEIAAYYAATTAVDDQVGRLIQALKDTNRAQDTIVLVTSDHGDMLGSQGARLKRKPWEESIRVPGILRYLRSVKPEQRLETLLTHVDIAPTLLALCGLSIPSEMQGSDLSRIVLGKSKKGPDSAFFQIFVPYAGDGTEFPWRGVRTERYMYARSETKPWVLYDLKKDPDELNNLATNTSAASIRAEMERKLSQWMTRTEDSWSMNSMAPVEDKGRLYRFETFYTIAEYLKWAAVNPSLVPKD
jgi:arylsulfatase A-like enzyme